jgi:flagellin
MSADALGLSGASIATHEGASATVIGRSIVDVAAYRASLGATQNRLSHKISNLDTAAESLQNAESRIRDIDIARQMTVYMMQNILIQVATAMLSQANSAPRSVLSLLNNAVLPLRLPVLITRVHTPQDSAHTFPHTGPSSPASDIPPFQPAL